MFRWHLFSVFFLLHFFVFCSLSFFCLFFILSRCGLFSFLSLSRLTKCCELLIKAKRRGINWCKKKQRKCAIFWSDPPPFFWCKNITYYFHVFLFRVSKRLFIHVVTPRQQALLLVNNTPIRSHVSRESYV